MQDSIEGIQVIYTRRTDEFIELHKRAQIANESGGDVFISIHCNSSKAQQAHGTETFVMGLHKTSENLEVAKYENASIFFEEDYKQQYEGFDPNADEDYILLSMFQSVSIDQSIYLSSIVQNHIIEKASRNDRGVKQAGFWVLYKTTMPGVLIELGFISNPTEEKFLMSECGQDSLARAIYCAVREYKTEFEDHNKDLKPVQITHKEEVPESMVFYRVQFASFKKEKGPDFKKFRGVANIKVYEHEGLYKYTSGNELTIEKAREIKAELEKKGFTDTFIVAFFEERRISLDEAQRLTQNKN
ncbi:MAG: N-acetylmuramoyl-L-alanine amidase [Bacteroidetes bacterium]|nr:N-acetylmuramoyl-L-alanine amidase [Bacteroidota bacterium]